MEHQEERTDDPAPVDTPNLPEEGDDPDQFNEEPIPPDQFDDPEKVDADDTADNDENDTANPNVPQDEQDDQPRPPAPALPPSAGVEQAPGQAPQPGQLGGNDGDSG